MLNRKESMPTLVGKVEVYNFSKENLPMRSVWVNGEPWFLAKDVCDILNYSNSRDAIKKHCKDKGGAFCDTLTEGGIQKMKYINEGNMYRLIVNCNLPIAEVFESWIFDEVLPSIRKKGYYGVKKTGGDYVDARDVPYGRVNYQGGEMRVIEIEGEKWYSLNDVHGCIGSRTESSQSVKRLNAKRTLAKKIWIYGVTQPGWFVCELGVKLLLCASLKHQENKQLMLDFSGKEG